MGSHGDPPTWLPEWSEARVRTALKRGAPALADLEIALEAAPDLSEPNWAFSRAQLGPDVFAKFALSEPTAQRVWHEAQALELLGAEIGLAVPELVGSSRHPALLATRLISGAHPLDFETVAAAGPTRIDAIATGLARFLSQLHAPEVLRSARTTFDQLGVPPTSVEVSAERLRTDFLPMIEPQRQVMVSGWCDWIDEQLATPAEIVLVHGDFHPYNQLWDLTAPELLAVIDFESAGTAEPEFDFRVLPVFGPGVNLQTSTISHYNALSQREINLGRVMALHLLNYLGDALWRTKAGFPLPPPGDSPSAYVTESADRLAALGFDPASL